MQSQDDDSNPQKGMKMTWVYEKSTTTTLLFHSDPGLFNILLPKRRETAEMFHCCATVYVTR